MNFAANMLGLGNAATPAALKAMKELQELEAEREAGGESAGAGGNENMSAWAGEAAGAWAGKSAGAGGGEQKKPGSLQIYTANNEMCTFLIINISSLQLVPINMIAYRSQYGAVNPAAITVPVLIATMLSTLMGVIFCKAAEKFS